jgi:enoyl-CoA hydratase/carnithine racemase
MSEILYSGREGRVLRLTLNRPEKRNALSAALCRELVEALEAAENDPGVGAILLAANGKSFCAGMDLAELGAVSTAEIDLAQERLFTLGARLTKPIVAAIQGPALGGGTGLVANCHIVVASPEATFGLTEIHLGLWPFLVFRAVTAALGERRTVELALTGRVFGAPEAREMGLVHEVAPDAAARAAETAAAVAGQSPTALGIGMAFVREVRGADWQTAGEIARRIRGETFRSRDFHEGIRAFREKRPPRWPSLEAEDESKRE